MEREKSSDPTVGDDREAELAALVREVDVTLVRWAMTLSPFERIRVANRRLRAIRRFRRVPPERG